MVDLKGKFTSLTVHLPSVRKMDLAELKSYFHSQHAKVIGIGILGGVSVLAVGGLASYLRRRPKRYSIFQSKKSSLPMIQSSDKGSALPESKLQIMSYSDLTDIVGNVSSESSLSQYQDEMLREYRLYSAEESFPKLEGNKTYMALYLTKDLYKQLYKKKTYTGLTIDDVIQIGVDTPHHNFCGVAAGDEEVYDVFSPLVDPVLSARHQGFRRVDGKQPHSLNPMDIKGPELHKDFVNNVHFVAARSIKGYRFAPSCSRAERRELEEKLKRALETLTGEFNGTYISVSEITEQMYDSMSDVFKNMADEPCADWLVRGGYVRDWPDARGIYYNNNNSLVISVNKEDHLRIFLKNNSNDFVASFEKFASLMDQIEYGVRGQGLDFSHHPYLGYLSACPSTTGTALRLGVNLKLTKLCQVSIANTVKEGARFLIALERRLQRGLEVNDLLLAIGINEEPEIMS